MEFIYQCIDYLKANPTLAMILLGACALLAVVLIAIIAVSIKRSKAKKRAKAAAFLKAEQERKALLVKQQAEEAQKKAEAAAAAQKALEEKLEAQRLEAEKAEAERLAAEKEAAEKAEAERRAAEKEAAEKAEAERRAAEKEAAEKAEAERIAAEKEAIEKAEGEAIAKADAQAEKEEDAIQKAIAEKTEKEVAQKAKKEQAAKEKAAKPVVAKPVAKAPAKTATGTVKSATASKPASKPTATKTSKKYSGKWTIYRVVADGEDLQEEMYFFELHASNGEKLLSSEEYTSQSGAMKGIQTHKSNIEKGNFKITLSKKGDYIFKLLSGKNTLLCTGANYPTLAGCESAIESTKRFAQTATIDETIHDKVIKVFVDDDGEIPPLPDGYNGKWIIESHEGLNGEPVYYFELFANNGEKLLVSEEYTTYIGAVNGIQTHKTNIEKGNFRISLTKRGDYIYKLLNGNGQLLCLGEHYKTKRLCQNAVESVRRFSANSPVLVESSLIK